MFFYYVGAWVTAAAVARAVFALVDAIERRAKK